MERHESIGIDEIRQWPAVVDLVQAAAAFRVGRTAAYEMAVAGTFPVRLIKVGRRWRVATEDILAALGAARSSSSGAPVSGEA